MKPKFVALEYLWWGVCIGGTHYTGSIIYEGKKVELTRKLGRREAKEMAEKEDRLWFARQVETNKFNSFAQLARAATKWCDENLSGDWLILEHDTINPHRPVAGTGYFKPRLRLLMRLAKAWEKIPNSKREGKLWDLTYEAFEALIKPPKRVKK